MSKITNLFDDAETLAIADAEFEQDEFGTDELPENVVHSSERIDNLHEDEAFGLSSEFEDAYYAGQSFDVDLEG